MRNGSIALNVETLNSSVGLLLCRVLLIGYFLK